MSAPLGAPTPVDIGPSPLGISPVIPGYDQIMKALLSPPPPQTPTMGSQRPPITAFHPGTSSAGWSGGPTSGPGPMNFLLDLFTSPESLIFEKFGMKGIPQMVIGQK